MAKKNARLEKQNELVKAKAIVKSAANEAKAKKKAALPTRNALTVYQIAAGMRQQDIDPASPRKVIRKAEKKLVTHNGRPSTRNVRTIADIMAGRPALGDREPIGKTKAKKGGLKVVK